MTIARLGGFCAIVLLSSSAALANDECNIGSWNVSFLVDATYLDADLTAKVSSKTNNVLDLEMPDIAAGSKGWNACFNTVGNKSATVVVSYSTDDGTERYILQYGWSTNGQGMHVQYQDVGDGNAYTAMFKGPSTVELEN